jgi:hypothetical protein
MKTAELTDFDLLEKKIMKAAKYIEQLQAEKKHVEDANIKLKEELDSLYITNEELTKGLKNLKKEKNKKNDVEKTREELSNKIEEMLAQLEGLDI